MYNVSTWWACYFYNNCTVIRGPYCIQIWPSVPLTLPKIVFRCIRTVAFIKENQQYVLQAGRMVSAWHFNWQFVTTIKDVLNRNHILPSFVHERHCAILLFYFETSLMETGAYNALIKNSRTKAPSRPYHNCRILFYPLSLQAVDTDMGSTLDIRKQDKNKQGLAIYPVAKVTCKRSLDNNSGLEGELYITVMLKLLGTYLGSPLQGSSKRWKRYGKKNDSNNIILGSVSF